MEIHPFQVQVVLDQLLLGINLARDQALGIPLFVHNIRENIIQFRRDKLESSFSLMPVHYIRLILIFGYQCIGCKICEQFCQLDPYDELSKQADRVYRRFVDPQKESSFAETLEGMPLADAMAVAMERLRLIYGDDSPEPDQAIASDWIQSSVQVTRLFYLQFNM